MPQVHMLMDCQVTSLCIYITGYLSSNSMIINHMQEFARIWKQSAMAQCKVLSQHLYGKIQLAYLETVIISICAFQTEVQGIIIPSCFVYVDLSFALNSHFSESFSYYYYLFNLVQTITGFVMNKAITGVYYMPHCAFIIKNKKLYT